MSLFGVNVTLCHKSVCMQSSVMCHCLLCDTCHYVCCHMCHSVRLCSPVTCVTAYACGILPCAGSAGLLNRSGEGRQGLGQWAIGPSNARISRNIEQGGFGNGNNALFVAFTDIESPLLVTVCVSSPKVTRRLQWNLSIVDTFGTQLAVPYTVEPLYRGHHWDPAGCPVYSGTFL